MDDINIRSDSFYDVDIFTPNEYNDIVSEPDEGLREAKKHIYSIIKKCQFEKDTAEDLASYFYICNKCEATIYYYERETHRLYHLEQDTCCCIL